MVSGKRRAWVGLSVLTLLGLMLLSLLVPTANAQTQTDNPDDLVKALANQRYFVANSVKANQTFMSKNADIEAQLRDTVNKYKKDNVFIAVISNSSFTSKFNNQDSFAANALSFLSNPKPEVFLLVNAQSNNVLLIAPKLSAAERDAIIKDAQTAAVAKNLTAGTVTAAQQAAEKISSNESGGTLLTIGIVAVVLLVIAGAVSFLLINTKRSWKQRLNRVESLANQVSDQVVKVSDEISFLPDASREKTSADFGTATQNFSEANTRLRELQGASPVSLLLKGADYERKLNLTGAQFEQVRQSLGRVAQETQRSLPPI